MFPSSKGEMYKAIVEFAPSQQVPKRLPSRDSFCGTIDDDPDYLEFLKSLKTQPTDVPKEIEVKKAASKPADPLVDFVNTQRAERIANGTFYQPRKHNLRRKSKAKQQKNCRSTENVCPDFQLQHFSENTRATGYNNVDMNPSFYYPSFGF
ncbi:hypothetical protein AVEN_223360-1 [Araneus ventricosus]|uniref:UPF3 domain-containing protein n=1 Tax=Araneus ventricosus TaxID=182803 RepID=A0A4Y2UM90_ARAVE|nr:hypothetical protein AVEN_223360-1 [Araneus ventricosus]